MIYFRRVLRYLIPQHRTIALSVLCALIVALLFSLSIAAMLPLMKVMIGEEGPHGWINRAIIRHRSGIHFGSIELSDFLKTEDESKVTESPLRIIEIDQDSPAEKAGLKNYDIIQDIILTASPNKKLTRSDMLEILAQWKTSQTVSMVVAHYKGSPETIKLQMDKPPIYAPAASWLLGFLPQAQGIEFKRKCIIFIIIMILVATLLRCVLRFIQEYLVRKVSYQSITALRRDAYRQTIRLPLSYFSQEGISDTMSRFVQDSNQIHIGITTLFGKAVREPFKIIALAGAAFMINMEMTLIVMMGAPIAVLMIGKLGRKMKRVTKRTLTSWSMMLAHLQESLIGIRVVKGYHREAHEEENFARINEKLLKQQKHLAKIDAAGGPLVESLGMSIATVGMIFAAYWLTETEMKTSDFFALLALLAALAETGRKLGDVIPRIQAANASAERVYKMIDAPVEPDPAGALELPRMRKSLQMHNIHFQYQGSPVPTLVDINLRVQAGETVAIVGPNGSGKTTLTSLIPRFFVPKEGKITIDGIDIAEVSLGSLREQIGLVTQQTVVFNDTIAANIAYGNLEAMQEEIIAAAQRAYAHEFIIETAEGYQTIVGEQGAGLSGGQLQRLSIARAILRNPSILIFDEAMSQIDTESETKIQKALAEFSRDRTSFIIAHRLSTIIDADKIVVMDKGKIIAQGRHQELLQSCTLYKQLYEVQFVLET